MASTNGCYQMEKDQQLSCWLDNEDLNGMITSEDLPEDCVIFDPCEFLSDPQSPSAVLNSLEDAMTESSNDQDSFLAFSFTEGDDNSFTFPSSVSEQSNSPPQLLGTADPVLGDGLISDYELLQLKGISLKSPRGHISTPSSPLLLPQSSPTTRCRLADSIDTTSRMAKQHSEPRSTNTSVSIIDIFENDPGFLQHLSNHYECVTDLLDPNHMPIDNNGLPLSPPLTSKVPHSKSYSDTMPFSIGELDDPLAGKFTTLHVKNDRITSTTTQAMNNDFFSHGARTISHNSTPVHQSKQRGMSSAEWPMEGIISDDDSRLLMPSSSAYITDEGSLISPDWLEDTPILNMHSYPPLHEHNTSNTAAFYDHNDAIHDQQGNIFYDYPSEISDIMISMPQPHQPEAAVLTDNMPKQFMSPTYHSHSSPHRPHSQHQYRGHYTPPRSQHRHSQPRSLALGTRNHYRNMSSQRQTSLHRSSSPGVLLYREESVSPSPSKHRIRRSTSSSGISIRKKRSWAHAPRTPRLVSYSDSHFLSNNPPLGGGIDFVNFTPGDKNVLMTGVAPSGSSKTKARREKEAADRRRMLNEAAVKAVVAAGGDVEKLVKEGFAFET